MNAIPKYWVWVLAVFFGVFGWLLLRWVKSDRLESETRVLAGRIEKFRADAGEFGPELADPGPLARRSGSGAGGNQRFGRGKIDWARIAAGVRRDQGGGIPDVREMLELQTFLLAMDAEALGQALDEIAAADLSEDDATMLSSMVADVLIQKDPQALLRRFDDGKMNVSRMSPWQLQSALNQWAAKGPEAALAWYQAAQASGSLASKRMDGTGSMQPVLLGGLLPDLLERDQALAMRQLEALTEDDRVEALQTLLFAGKPVEPESLREMRELVPDQRYEELLGQSSAMMVQRGGFAEVSKFISDAEATAQERAAMVKTAATSSIQRHGFDGKPVGIEELREMRAWAANESPESADAAAGSAVAMLIHSGRDSSEVAGLARQMITDGAGDEFIAALVEGLPYGRDAVGIRDLVETIQDPTLRETMLGKLAKGQQPLPRDQLPEEAFDSEHQ